MTTKDTIILERRTLQEWLEERYWSADDLASAMDLTYGGVRKWLRGTTPSGHNRRLALKVLKLKDGQILWGEVKGG